MHLLVLLTFVLGLMTAFVGRFEIKTVPRNFLFTKSYLGFLIFVFLLLLPFSIYFFLFYGDWLLLYFANAHSVPSALVLFSLIFQTIVGTLGFFLGVQLIRKHHEVFFPWILVLLLFVSSALVFLHWERLSHWGSFDQFQGKYGLVPVSESSIPLNLVLMGSLLLLALISLWGRLYWSRKFFIR